jgi:hypothetical protein
MRRLTFQCGCPQPKRTWRWPRTVEMLAATPCPRHRAEALLGRQEAQRRARTPESVAAASAKYLQMFGGNDD